MEVSIIELPQLKAVVNKVERNGTIVREAWKRVEAFMDGHAGRANEDYGLVFIPEWQWADGVKQLWVGLQVNDFPELTSDMEELTLPARTYAKLTVCGDRGHMDAAYRYLWDWFKNEGVERDCSEGSYGFEANRLKPVNPFHIPADVIDHFEFDIYAPIKSK
ncbi:AraC family transcriptional regulator [Paenibacillus sp. H1-7]|uniref:GyrI-like domain-containing protein n=1 Tax=Paenibacillus sp. H1-7 TaxID=2282849 RepID=UPI001EF7DF98|nr:GyrI-like domain-containing protein [Paenibacillus sp. H1-7]ULL18043.1 AraC family transcriptional regulator [Paenibacillus sp. H1-7]